MVVIQEGLTKMLVAVKGGGVSKTIKPDTVYPSVALDKTAVKNSLNHGIGRDKSAAFAAILMC